MAEMKKKLKKRIQKNQEKWKRSHADEIKNSLNDLI